MQPFEISGNTPGTALRFASAGDGRLTMAVIRLNRDCGGVDLRPEWLLPLAAWFAGEARPGIHGHDEYGTPQGRSLAISGDEAAVVWDTRLWARLDCLLPFGAARVRIGPRGEQGSRVVMLPPHARQDVAMRLREADAAHRARPTT